MLGLTYNQLLGNSLNNFYHTNKRVKKIVSFLEEYRENRVENSQIVIKNEKGISKIYLLNIKNHELDFSQEGQIGLSVSYIGSIESDMRNIYLYDNTEQVTRQKDFIEKKKIEDKKKLEQRKLSVLTSLLKELKSKKNKPKEKIPLQRS